jgi:hypothetical protein
MRRRVLWGYAFLAYLTVFTSGCGFLFVHGPPADHEQRAELFSCTEGNIGPILDVIWASLNAIGLVYYAVDEEFRNDVESASAVASAGWIVLSGSAAIVGFNKTKKCREARMAQNRRLRGGQDGQGEADPTFAAPSVDSTEGVWGRVAEWTDPMFPLPDSTVSDTASGI